MEQQLSPDQSLGIIQEMLSQAKASFHKLSPYFLIWGVLLMTAGIAEFVMRQQGVPIFWVAWPIAGVLGGITATIQGVRSSSNEVTSFSDRLYAVLWGGFVVTLILMLVLTVRSGVDPNPFIALITGLPTFVTGSLIRFAPLKWGGIGFWVLGAVAFVAGPQYSALIFSLAILIGYLIPGFMLMRKENGIRST